MLFLVVNVTASRRLEEGKHRGCHQRVLQPGELTEMRYRKPWA